MNANELVQILEIGGAWEDDSGNLHNVPTGEFEQALSEAIVIIERARIRETATEPPTREDADKDGFIQAHHEAAGWMVHTIKTVNCHPENYLFWTRMPEDPEVT